MLKKVLSLAFLAIFAGVTLAAEEVKPTPPLKVLIIGNSFSICVTRFTPQIVKAAGKEIDIASLYIGGCPLEAHWKNVEKASDPKFQPYRYDRVTVTNGVITSTRAQTNVLQVLTAERWDVVTVQQASHASWKPESYHPWGDNLVAKIREVAPQAKILVQETWSYPSWDKRLAKFGFDGPEMYRRLHKAYTDFAKSYGLEIIPTGTAVEILPDRERLFNRPDFHLNRKGEYLQGLIWAQKLLGIDPLTVIYYPEKEVNAALAEELRQTASKALKLAKEGK